MIVVQLSVAGLYLPPVLNSPADDVPPHTIISLPVQIAVCESRGDGAFVVVIAVQLSSVQPARCGNVGDI